MRLRHREQHDDETVLRAHWDFFSGGDGSKPGYVSQISGSGCSLKTSEAIEFRRWIRMLIQDSRSNLSFTAVGRVVRCENLLVAGENAEPTLYLYRVEFTYPLPVACLRGEGQASPQEDLASLA